MSTKITLTINSNRFDIDVDEKFAKYLNTQIAEDFGIETNSDIKLLIQAYVRKNYEIYEHKNEIDLLTQRVEDSL
jgi:hypothetical protein